VWEESDNNNNTRVQTERNKHMQKKLRKFNTKTATSKD